MGEIRKARRCDEGAGAIREGSCRRHSGGKGSIRRVALMRGCCFGIQAPGLMGGDGLAEKMNLALTREFMDEHASRTTLVVAARRGGAGPSGASARQRACRNTAQPATPTPHGAPNGTR